MKDKYGYLIKQIANRYYDNVDFSKAEVREFENFDNYAQLAFDANDLATELEDDVDAWDYRFCTGGRKQ